MDRGQWSWQVRSPSRPGPGALIGRAVGLTALVFLAASCVADSGSSDQPASPSTTPGARQSTPATTPEPAPPSPSTTGRTPSPGSAPPGVQGLVELAVADLATRTGVPPSDITVVAVEPVTWPDRSLGCPMPGMRYEQVPVDGALIVLAIDSAEYEYHSGGSRSPFLCTTKG